MSTASELDDKVQYSALTHRTAPPPEIAGRVNCVCVCVCNNKCYHNMCVLNHLCLYGFTLLIHKVK